VNFVVKKFLSCTNKHIWATEQDIIDCEDCWEAMKKDWEKEKIKNKNKED
jgi:hypothetical protein